MPYPNSNILNIIIPQTSASIDPTSTQAPFVERIISGSRLVLQTDTTGTLIGSSDLNVNSITASNISASGYISASNLYVKTNITDAGTLTVLGITTLASLTASTALFNGVISASAGITSSASNLGALTVVGNSILSTVTASNISASGNISSSNEYIAGTLTVIGNSTLSNVFATNITASNISASGNISASTLRVETSIVDGGTLTVLGNTVLGDTTADTTRITGSTSISGSLTVVGNTTLQSTFVTNLTASNISASTSLTASALYVDINATINGDLTVNGGDIVLSSTATNISLLDNVGNALDIKEAANSYIKVATTNAAENVTFGTTPTVYLIKTTDNDLLTYDNGALIIGGGVGINKNLFVGANTYTVGNSSITGSLTVGTTLRVNGNSILGDSLSDVNTSSGSLKVLSTTNNDQSTYTNGALIVDGGVGIGKNLFVSGSMLVGGDFTVFGSSSVVYISSSTVIINDNIIQLNAFFPFERYAGFEVFDSGSNQRSASLLWDGQSDNWTTVDQNNSASNIIIGPTASFGSAIPSLTVNRLTKAYEGNGITDSLISDDGTTLRYTGNVISASSITASYGTVTNVSGTLITYVTGSFTALTVVTGSSPGVGLQVPAHPTASGMPGQIEVDNNFIYVYTNNIWKRVPLSTWSL